jgi:hypothetical protein
MYVSEPMNSCALCSARVSNLFILWTMRLIIISTDYYLERKRAFGIYIVLLCVYACTYWVCVCMCVVEIDTTTLCMRNVTLHVDAYMYLSLCLHLQCCSRNEEGLCKTVFSMCATQHVLAHVHIVHIKVYVCHVLCWERNNSALLERAFGMRVHIWIYVYVPCWERDNSALCESIFDMRVCIQIYVHVPWWERNKGTLHESTFGMRAAQHILAHVHTSLCMHALCWERNNWILWGGFCMHIVTLRVGACKYLNVLVWHCRFENKSLCSAWDCFWHECTCLVYVYQCHAEKETTTLCMRELLAFPW